MSFVPPVVGASSTQSSMSDLNWLLRYAKHCGFQMSDQHNMTVALRSAFGSGAWRVVCRTPKANLLPILRNRDLSIQSLIDYCQRLVHYKFIKAPRAMLLDHFLTQRRVYFNCLCRIPQDEDYLLMRIAERESFLRKKDVALVTNWVHQEGIELTSRHNWSSLIKRAKTYCKRQELALVSKNSRSWYFYCGTTDWRGYVIEPIRNSAELWLESMILGNCLYKLRHECNTLKPSRFFSIRRGNQRIATLELSWHEPREEFLGMDRELGRWELLDLRLSYNRLPPPHLQEAMQGFASMYNLWSKRPTRMPAGHADEIRNRIKKLGRCRLRIA